jgi:Fe-S-cluster containining protein
MGVIRKEGFDFGFDPGACADCPGHCCRGESGQIWVDQQEILAISGFLGINVIDCIRTYLDRIGSRLSIKERFADDGFECVFFEGVSKRCSVYTVRPAQCRQFPFWEYFRKHKDEAMRECPGIRE